VPRRGHHAVRLPDSTVLVIGGIDAAGAPVAQIERFSLESGFAIVPNLRIEPGLTGLTVTPLPSGAVLLAGGNSASGNVLDTAFILRLDAQDGSVGGHETDPLAIPRAAHQAALLCDGTVLLAGGTQSPAFAERYNPTHQGRR
jgi:Galactose oxidase, central domain